MNRPSKNDSRLYKHMNSSEASLSAIPLTKRQLLPRPKPPDENLIERVQFSPSPATSIETSSHGSPLYMSSASYPAPTSAKDSPRTRNRSSRQSLPFINNNNSQSSPSVDGNDVAQKTSQSLAREEIAWKVINREIKEWQNVCHTGRPSWWTPSSNGARRVQSQSSINRDLSTFGQSDWVDQDEYIYYPGLCFEFERRKDSAKDGEPWLQQLAYMIAVQLLSACFTLPVEQFSNCRMGIYLTYDTFGVPEMPDERLSSALRLHTNHRWSPAFGHEARTTSPETRYSASYGGHTPRKTLAVDSSPDVHDSSWRKKKKQQHRARHVTPAETEHQQEYWEDTYEKPYGFGESPLRTPTLGSWRDGSWRNRRNLTRSASCIPVPGRVVQSAPSTPRMWYKPPILSRHTHAPAHSSRDEYPFPITAAVDGEKPARYSIHPHLRSEPHPVFMQPVRELEVKHWRTFRRRFGYSSSHGNPDNTTTTTNTTFTEERRATIWGPPSPASLAPAPSHGVRRRRDAQSRHDIHSSSMESSPRYNTPNSADTHSRTPSGAISPGMLCAPPQSSPAVGEVDDLITAARAVTNSSSNIPQEPLTASQPFPVFTPNNTPNYTDEENLPAHITRTEAGYFTPDDSPNASGSTFVPRVKTSGKGRSGTGTRGSRRASSRLSKVCTQEEVTEEELKYQSIKAAKRKLFDADKFSVLTTPTEESDSDVSKSKLRRRTVVIMSDPPPISNLSPNLSSLVRMDSPGPDQRLNLSGTPLCFPTSTTIPRPSSIASVDTDPFAFLSPRRDSPGSGSPYSPGQVRPHRPSPSSMSRMSRNESPITQRRDSPLSLSPAVPDPWANRPSMSYTDRWTPPRISPTISRDVSRSPSTTYMSAIDRQPSTSPLPPSGSDMPTKTYIFSPRPTHSPSHLLSPSVSRADSRPSTASSPEVRPETIKNRSKSALRFYPQPTFPDIVHGDSCSSTASSARRSHLRRAVTPFSNFRPSMERAALSWKNTPNNSEDGGRRASWQSHRNISSNDDAYDAHAVDCHSNLPPSTGSRRGSNRDSASSPMPGRMMTTKTEPMPRKAAQMKRKREVIAAEATRSAYIGARPSKIRRGVRTPVVRQPNLEYEEELRIGIGRNRLSRVNSSGTTHFSTRPEGIEVQGIPAGPDKEAWDELGELTGRVTEGIKRLGSRRRKKSRSFL